MMPTTTGMSHMIPSHVLRVGQTICMDHTQQDAARTKSNSYCEDTDLDVSLENLNQLILELDPTFEPIHVNRSPSCISPTAESFCSDDVSGCVLVPRGCPSSLSPASSPSIPIPTRTGCQGGLVFSGSPASTLPPLPFGSAPRRNPSPRQEFSQGSLRLSPSNRNSNASLLSTSTCSDTSYILGSNLSLAGEDTGDDSPDSIPPCTPRSVWTKQGHLLEHQKAASPSGSQTDIPLLLINGAPEVDLQSPGPLLDLIHNVPASPSKQKCSGFQSFFSGSQPSMRFVMDTSKFWFRPHISRAEAEALLKDKEAGMFVIRDSTSYRGSFGLAMKVDQTCSSDTGCPGEGGSDVFRHFLIESSAKGVRIRGSSQEPFFGSLSALVYQHTISAYALPCKLQLHCQELGTSEERTNERVASGDKSKTACNFIYLNAVPTEMLTGACAVQKAVTCTLEKDSASFTPTVVNMKVSAKGITLTDMNRKLFFRRHYPAHLLSYSGQDPDNRLWRRGSSCGARMFGFVAKSAEAGVENVCHVFAEYDPLQPFGKVAELVQATIAKP